MIYSVVRNLFVVFVSTLLAGAAVAASPTSGKDASSVSVTVDGVNYQCTANSNPGSDFIISGNYVTTATPLCNQSARATVYNGVMTQVEITYLTPCTGQTDTYTCSSGVCTNNGNTLTVIARDQYYFLNTAGNGGRFNLQ